MMTVPAAPFPALADLLPRRARELLAGAGELPARTAAQVCGVEEGHMLRLAVAGRLAVHRKKSGGDLWVRLDGSEAFALRVARGRRAESARRATA